MRKSENPENKNDKVVADNFTMLMEETFEALFLKRIASDIDDVTMSVNQISPQRLTFLQHFSKY